MPLRNRLLPTVAVLTSALVAVPLAAGAGGSKTLHLTAVVKKDVSKGETGEKIVLALMSGPKDVGSVRFPGCAGTGSSIVCGGTVGIDGLGSNLATIVTFECPTVAPFKCEAGKGFLETKGGSRKGSITLRVEPRTLEPGSEFPVVVSEKGSK